MGTAAYMAPEQIEGDPLDARTDIYALGVTAFEMLTGERPFPEDDPRQLLKLHLTRDITDPKILNPHIPEALRRFVITAGRRDPDQRYADMDQAMAELVPLMPAFQAQRETPGTEAPQRAALTLTLAEKTRLNIEAIVRALRAEAHRMGAELTFRDPMDS
jgi:serine/threonine protein kinase